MICIIAFPSARLRRATNLVEDPSPPERSPSRLAKQLHRLARRRRTARRHQRQPRPRVFPRCSSRSPPPCWSRSGGQASRARNRASTRREAGRCVTGERHGASSRWVSRPGMPCTAEGRQRSDLPRQPGPEGQTHSASGGQLSVTNSVIASALFPDAGFRSVVECVKLCGFARAILKTPRGLLGVPSILTEVSPAAEAAVNSSSHIVYHYPGSVPSRRHGDSDRDLVAARFMGDARAMPPARLPATGTAPGAGAGPPRPRRSASRRGRLSPRSSCCPARHTRSAVERCRAGCTGSPRLALRGGHGSRCQGAGSDRPPGTPAADAPGRAGPPANSWPPDEELQARGAIPGPADPLLPGRVVAGRGRSTPGCSPAAARRRLGVAGGSCLADAEGRLPLEAREPRADSSGLATTDVMRGLLADLDDRLSSVARRR